jgi:hypothetical protein
VFTLANTQTPLAPLSHALHVHFCVFISRVQALGDELRAKFAATKPHDFAFANAPHPWQPSKHLACALLRLQALGDELRAKFAVKRA